MKNDIKFTVQFKVGEDIDINVKNIIIEAVENAIGEDNVKDVAYIIDTGFFRSKTKLHTIITFNHPMLDDYFDKLNDIVNKALAKYWNLI